MTRLLVLAALAGAALTAVMAWSFRPELAAAGEPSIEVTTLRSQVASLEAALYVAEAQACPNLGVHAVPAPAKKARRK